MALQSSGSISLFNIAGEFGGSTPHSLSEYYDAADGIPASGAISVSQFYGTSSYNGPSAVELWVVGGGGGGGSVYGASSNSAGGGGAGGEVYNTTTTLPIGAGTVFTITIGNGGTTGNSGGITTIDHGTTGSGYSGIGGGRGAGVHNGAQDPNAQRGGGAGSGNVTGGAAGYPPPSGPAIGSGGDGLIHTDGHVAGGGGGGAGGSNSFINGRLDFVGNLTAGRGQYGQNLSQGLPSTLLLGYGGDGGVSSGVAWGGGANGANGATASATGTYGSGGGGGAWTSSATTLKAGADGQDGVAIIQYSDSFSAPSSLTGTYTEHVLDGFRTYVFTGDGTLTF